MAQENQGSLEDLGTVTAPEKDMDVLLRSGVDQKLLPGNLGPWDEGQDLRHLISFQREKRLERASPPLSALSTDRAAPREAQRSHMRFSSGLPENKVLANDFHGKFG